MINATVVIAFVVTNAIIGLIGGVAGFVLLSTSNARPVKAVRNALDINGSSVAVPVHENVDLTESSAIIDAAQKVLPAVVAISASQQVSDYFGDTSTEEVSGGSGMIITSDGYILTNKHVVDTTGVQYSVVLNNNKTYPATVVSEDTLNDLAIVKINATNLPVVTFGSSSSLQVGQYVLAVGNALGQFSNSVTQGIVSATDRSITAGGEDGDTTERLTNLIQTDAAINPGNSGGPLVNIAGQVVGIDTAIASADDSSSDSQSGSIGIGFALPIDSVKPVVTQALANGGQIIRPYLGVRYVPVTPELQQQDNLPVNYGALVEPGENAGEVAVLPGSPADKAGIQANDILLTVNGDQITQDNPLPDLLQKYNIGDTVTVTLMRNNQQKTVKVTLQKETGS